MGYYINGPAKGKAAWLRAHCEAVIIPRPERFSVPAGKALICVADSGSHDAAAYIFSGTEFEYYTQPGDWRDKTWLLMDRDMAEQMSGYRS